MKKVLIMGAAGMAGHMIYYYLRSLNKYKIYTACFRNKVAEDSVILDVYNTDGIKAALRQFDPDCVINCVGVLVNGAKRSPENAVYINAYFPHLLARLINEEKQSGILIHISTDCVFSGAKGSYADNDTKDALDIYGMTKNLGEIIDSKNLTIRTSIIGPELKESGEGLMHWVFSQRGKNGINGYEKSIWGGITTLELAKAVYNFIEHHVTGLYQLSNGERISKYALIKIIIEQFKLGIPLQKVDGTATDKSILPSIRKDFSFNVPSYSSMIEELYCWMLQKRDLYYGYFTSQLGQLC
jgi:dTDP-4-dehydrorhamnose reductase